jgi:hypothetical protein
LTEYDHALDAPSPQTSILDIHPRPYVIARVM